MATPWAAPVGVAIAKDGPLLVAYDVGNSVWRVTGSVRNAALAEGPKKRSDIHARAVTLASAFKISSR